MSTEMGTRQAALIELLREGLTTGTIAVTVTDASDAAGPDMFTVLLQIAGELDDAEAAANQAMITEWMAANPRPSADSVPVLASPKPEGTTTDEHR